MPELLVDRIRAEIGAGASLREVRMFGGLCFMLNDNMLLGTLKDGSLLVRVGEAGQAAALQRPGAAAMEMGGRVMKGYVVVDPSSLDDDALRWWIATARQFVGTLPAKARKLKR